MIIHKEREALYTAKWYNNHMQKEAIQEIKGTGATWVNLTKVSKAELAGLSKRFGFLDIDLHSCLPPVQRPDIAVRDKYLFMTLLFPVYDRKTGLVRPSEVDFFITKKTIITIHTNGLPPVTELMTQLKRYKNLREKTLHNPAELLYHILDNLINHCFPMLAHISKDVDSVEERITKMTDRHTIDEIYRLKNNIVDFKKSMKPHATVVRKLIATAPKFFPTKKLDIYFQNLVDHIQDIWDRLEGDSETLDALEDSHISLLNVRTNDVMRVLTLFAVIVFPLTLVAGIFGMNTLHTPIIGDPHDFWIIIFLMMVGMLAMLGYFKWRKWL